MRVVYVSADIRIPKKQRNIERASLSGKCNTHGSAKGATPEDYNLLSLVQDVHAILIFLEDLGPAHERLPGVLDVALLFGWIKDCSGRSVGCRGVGC